MATIRLIELALIGYRKNYVVEFQKGFNYISGNTSTGKTSIFEMIDYALGAKKHKSYIEIGNSCTHVSLILYIGDELFKIKRPLFDFKAQIIVENWNEDSKKFLFYNNYEIDTPKNKHSFAAFLIEKIGLADVTIKGQMLSSRDVLKYCYLKQTTIDDENILNEKQWELNFKRKAVFEIMFNIFNEGYEDTRKTIEERQNELKELETKLKGIQEFVSGLKIKNISECYEYAKQLQSEIQSAQSKINELKKGKYKETDESINLQIEIDKLKDSIQNLFDVKLEQKQFINKLTMLMNQYSSEINKKQLAIQGYLAFNEYEFAFCPNCLKPLNQAADISSCCLCGSEKTDNASEIVILKKEIKALNRRKNELIKHLSSEKIRLQTIEDQLHEKENLLAEKEFLLNHLTANYVNSNLEMIETLNYEIGSKYYLIQKAEESLKMFDEIDRQKKIIKDKNESILALKNNLKAYKDSMTEENDLFRDLSNIFSQILKDFKYPKLSTAYIDENDYLPYVRGRKYDDIGSSGGVTLITMAYYLSLMLLGVEKPFFHPGFLMIDSPRKNLGADNKDDEVEFKDEEIFNSIIRTMYSIAESNKDKLQLIVINNGYPDFVPKECIVAEFDSDGRNGMKKGLIDDID